MPKKQKKFQKKVLKRISSEDDDEQNEVGDQVGSKFNFVKFWLIKNKSYFNNNSKIGLRCD